MTQEELALKERLEVNQQEMATQEWGLAGILEKLYNEGLYKEYIDLSRITEAMIHINERKKDIHHALENLQKNKKV